MALTASVDICAEIKSTLQWRNYLKSGRVWRKVPEGDECGSESLQALVYDILSPTTAVFNYAIGS